MDKNLDKAMNYCSRSEHCIADVKQKLWDWKVPQEEHEKIIKELIDNDFVNEKRYAEAYVKDKFRFNHWGRVKISLMLKAKKIGTDTIDDALSFIDEDEYMEVLRNIIDTEFKRVKAASENERKARVLRYAIGRGFETSLARKIIF